MLEDVTKYADMEQQSSIYRAHSSLDLIFGMYWMHSIAKYKKNRQDQD